MTVAATTPPSSKKAAWLKYSTSTGVSPAGGAHVGESSGPASAIFTAHAESICGLRGQG